MSDTALLLDAAFMGVLAGIVAFVLLAPLGIPAQAAGTFVIGRAVALGFAKVTT